MLHLHVLRPEAERRVCRGRDRPWPRPLPAPRTHDERLARDQVRGTWTHTSRLPNGTKVEKVTRENLNKYYLKTDPIDIAITRRLIDFHFLNEDKLLITDHNNSNHDYLIFDLPVSLEETSEMEYMERSRLAKLSATFGDRKKLDKSYFNQE